MEQNYKKKFSPRTFKNRTGQGKADEKAFACTAGHPFSSRKLTELILRNYKCWGKNNSVFLGPQLIENPRKTFCHKNVPRNPHRRKSLDSAQNEKAQRHVAPIWGILPQWAGVYPRGRGWAGYDSALLIAVALQHLVIAALKTLKTEQCKEFLQWKSRHFVWYFIHKTA